MVCMTTAAEAAGQMMCADRADVLQQLGGKYKETPAYIGIDSSGGLIEVLTSDDGATWTIILSLPNGTSCLLSAGVDWQPMARPGAGEPM